MASMKVQLVRRRASKRELDYMVDDKTTREPQDSRKSSLKAPVIPTPSVKLKKFKKYDTFIWLREPNKDGITDLGKPLNRLRSLSSL